MPKDLAQQAANAAYLGVSQGSLLWAGLVALALVLATVVALFWVWRRTSVTKIENGKLSGALEDYRSMRECLDDIEEEVRDITIKQERMEQKLDDYLEHNGRRMKSLEEAVRNAS